MADAAEVLPLPDEEPVDESPKNDDSAAADDSGEDKGKGVSFGTFLTVGPKQYQNVTVIGYDRLRDTVRAVRRSGDTVENIQIPFAQYKTLLEAQRQSDLATGRKPKKNLSGAVRGTFGKSVSLEGKAAQVIGYDAQNDEVLVSDDSGRRWMKSGDMLRATQTMATTPSTSTKATRATSGKRALKEVKSEEETKQAEQKPAPEAKSEESKETAEVEVDEEPEILEESGEEIDQDKTAQIQRAFEQGRITVQDPPGQRTVGLSVDSTGKILRQVETSATSIQPSSISYVSPRGESIALTDVDAAISEVTVPLNVEAEVSVQASPATSSSATIRETRAALQEERSATISIPPVQAGIAAVAAVSATIPASNEAALSAIKAAQNVLTGFEKSSANRQNQLQQISKQLGDVSDRIRDLQNRSSQATAKGSTTEASRLGQQIVKGLDDRRALLNQQTDLEVLQINEDNRAKQLTETIQQLTPDETGEIPQAKIDALTEMLPKEAVTASPIGTVVTPVAAALPTPPKVSPRTYAPGVPTRPTSAAANPSVRTPKPLRPLSGGSSSYGAQTQRAVDFFDAQQRDRQSGNGFSSAGQGDVLGEDSYEAAFATEGGREGYAGPLDIPERKTQTYAAGAKDEEEEPADIYGATEEESRARMSQINQSLVGEGPTPSQESTGTLSREARPPAPESFTTTSPASQTQPVGPSSDEIARQAALQQAVAATLLQQEQLEQQNQAAAAAGAAGEAQSKAKQIQNAKAAISDVIDAFDAIHGFADIVGLIATFAHLNARLVLTVFKKDLPFVPRANFPWECTAFFCFDIMVLYAALSAMIVPLIILAAVLTVVGGAAFGIADLLGAI